MLKRCLKYTTVHSSFTPCMLCGRAAWLNVSYNNKSQNTLRTYLIKFIDIWMINQERNVFKTSPKCNTRVPAVWMIFGSSVFRIPYGSESGRAVRGDSGEQGRDWKCGCLFGKRNERIERAARWLEGERERWRRGEVSQLCGDWSARALDRRRSAG